MSSVNVHWKMVNYQREREKESWINSLKSPLAGTPPNKVSGFPKIFSSVTDRLDTPTYLEYTELNCTVIADLLCRHNGIPGLSTSFPKALVWWSFEGMSLDCLHTVSVGQRSNSFSRGVVIVTFHCSFCNSHITWSQSSYVSNTNINRRRGITLAHHMIHKK